jgi:hypothetical protein
MKRGAKTRKAKRKRTREEGFRHNLLPGSFELLLLLLVVVVVAVGKRPTTRKMRKMKRSRPLVFELVW